MFAYLLSILTSGISFPDLTLVACLTPFLMIVAAGLWVFNHRYGLSERSRNMKIFHKGVEVSVKFAQKDPSLLPLPPTPLPLPFLGHLHLIAAYPTNPWAGFDAIRKQYGNVVRLQLGKYNSILVSSPEAIREVLITKGDHFLDRPHFYRHALIFGKNRQNSIVLCDSSEVHRARRAITRATALPRFRSEIYNRLGSSIHSNISKMLDKISKSCIETPETFQLNKALILDLCGRIFLEFLMEKDVDDLDPKEYRDICVTYDFIIYDINQMYLCDFIPALAPITARSYFKEIEVNSSKTLKFLDSIARPKFDQLKNKLKDEKNNNRQEENELDCMDKVLNDKPYQSNAGFLDLIFERYLNNQDTVTWDECLYQIGDLVGGHSAIGNLLYRLLGHLALNPDVQEELYNEARLVIEQRKSNGITIDEQSQMPLTLAAVFETLRHVSSPIVPHSARVNTSIQDLFIPKGTMVLFNLYHSNFSQELWDDPWAFRPSRFVTPEGTVSKPDYFVPFSLGKRNCLGYKLINSIMFASTANILLDWKLVPVNEKEESKMKDMLRTNGSVSLPFDGSCFEICLQRRKL